MTDKKRVVTDHGRHTAIYLETVDGMVSYIPMDSIGLEVQKVDERDFSSTYHEMPDYPVDKAAKLYAEFAVLLGATKEAMDFLASLTNITEEEFEMAVTKKAASAAGKAAKAAAKVPAKKAAAKKVPAKKVVAKKAAVKVEKQSTKEENSGRRRSASQMFKDLILEGKHTDDEIFKKVQKEFGLDDNKRSYVAWNRNDLVKKGLLKPQ
jgi:hypothetical protein